MGRKVIITGTNRGIGLAILERFAQEKDAYILAHARRETEEFISTINSIEKNNAQCKIEPLYFDLRNSDEIKSSLSQVLKVHKKIDVLVNNAAVLMPPQSFLMTDMNILREAFEINFFAWILITQLVCRAMIRNGSGAIVNISSVAALSGIEGQIDYTTSKAAVIGMTKRLANELAVHNIRTNAVAPGMTDAGMMKQMKSDMLARVIESLPCRRVARPEEIANAVYFLASDEASYINGHVLVVNGGGNLP